MFHGNELARLRARVTSLEQTLELVLRRLEIDPGELASLPVLGISPEVRRLAAEGKKIYAIKQLRTERPELGLQEAKDLVDRLYG